jgi:hypothetical protein
MLSVTNEPLMLSVIMLNVVMLSVIMRLRFVLLTVKVQPSTKNIYWYFYILSHLIERSG